MALYFLKKHVKYFVNNFNIETLGTELYIW